MVIVLPRGLMRWSRSLTVVLGTMGATTAIAADEAVIELTPSVAGLAPVENSTGVALESIVGEVIEERYPNRVVKIERHVVRDIHGDYVNHGPWIMYDEQGREMGHGNYRNDKPHGPWVRYFVEGEAQMLSGSWGELFTAPFESKATFEDGRLNGPWTIVDAQGHTVAIWNYENGERHGRSVWFFPEGCKWRDANYVHGELDGEFFEWASDSSLVSRDVYHAGYREETRIEWYSPSVPKIEAHYLAANERTRTNDDWWEGIRSTELLNTNSKDQRHGTWTSYYPNGQKAMQGEFRNDRAIGTFIWWHPNGLRAIEGQYVDGKQDGRWSWWYAGGKRFIQGYYDAGSQAGDWTRWTANGELVDSASYNQHIESSTSVADYTDPAATIELPSEPSGVIRPVADRRIRSATQR
ncbi:MAG TPA: hypothetical protein VHV77_12350 [Pirellulales bacterium]|nr:hypothetical protein [Pirellulales bacterium]